MSGFTKLVPEIVQSSIWNESPEVRVLWITLLAIKDAEGYVRGDIRTIARIANISEQHAKEGLTKFQEPDPNSHTPDNDGRRIEAAAGGFVILNHHLYREKDHKEEHAAYVRKWREQKDIKNCESQVNHPSASASSSVSASDLKGGCKGETAKSFKQWNVDDLKNAVESIEGTLDAEQQQEFIDYWTEPMGNGKPRIAGEKAWDTKRRMGRWARNNEKKHTVRGNNKQPKRPADVKMCWDVAIGQAIDALDRAKGSKDEDAVSRCLSVLNDKFRDMGKNRDGQTVATEAYEVWKFRNQKGEI